VKALLDTCVVVDFLQKREPFAENAASIFYAAARERFVGCITAKAATDIYYLVHCCTHSDAESREKLGKLLSIIAMLDIAADDVFRAISSETSDFEDAVMIETAVRSHMDCIVTRNARDYGKSPVPVYTPEEFLRLLERE